MIAFKSVSRLPPGRIEPTHTLAACLITYWLHQMARCLLTRVPVGTGEQTNAHPSSQALAIAGGKGSQMPPGHTQTNGRFLRRHFAHTSRSSGLVKVEITGQSLPTVGPDIAPGAVAVGVGIVLVFLLLFFITVYYVNPLYKMLDALDNYRSFGRKYNYSFEGDDQLSELNSGIMELTEENRELSRRIKDLRDK